jgi:hypothetical protein
MKLGQRLKDKVSGFTGIATSRTEFLNGCVRIALSPPVDKEGKMVDERWFDMQQLELVDDGILPKEEPEAVQRMATGGPQDSVVPSFGL